MTYCDCGGTYISKQGSVEIYDDKELGGYIIGDVQYKECNSCGEEFTLPEKTLKIIDGVESHIRNILIKSLPVGGFIGVRDTIKILGILRFIFLYLCNARQGFVYSTTIGKDKLYYKESVELFKKDGDGRFHLHRAVVNRLLGRRRANEI